MEPDEIRVAVPDSDKRLRLSTFPDCGEIGTLCLELPSFLAPVDRPSAGTYDLIRQTMEAKDVAAIPSTVPSALVAGTGWPGMA